MSERNGLEIAVIGMAGRFPRARDLDQFWQNLRNGVEGISFFTKEELAGLVPPSLLAHPSYVRAMSVLEGHDLFDAGFFDLSPREAEILDPQQRLLLEVAWEALEKAGHAGTSLPAGVFVGTSPNHYLILNVLSNPEVLSAVGPFGVMLANEKDFVAARLAYKLDLEGPSLTVQTACSTSLVATHLACQSLLAGECEIALAGGASVAAVQRGGYLFQEGGILSRDGHTRAFDARADGTAGGQGVGIVVLKLLDDAIAGGDHIHAVIKGSAINNDGSQRPGFTAPRRDGQAKVIRAAQMRAEVDAESIQYVEAHGTATPLGDPIEVTALTRAFRATTQRRSFCALGSVKTNIGHADAAAGIASLLKTVLALENEEIPPSLHFESPNPEADFAASPFYVNRELRPWKRTGEPRRAGVSSFGMGGANAHLILEEAPPPELSGPSRPWQLLTLSARTASALERASDDLAAHLKAHPGQSLADIAYTLRVGRRGFRFRRALVAAGPEEAAEALAARDPRRVWSSEREEGARALAFLLPGVGDQHSGMAAGLYAAEPVFRQEIDRCSELLRPHLGLDLREVLFAGSGSAPAAGPKASGLDLRALMGRGESAAQGSGPLYQTRIAQPAVFALGYALARLWMSWRVQPNAFLGYSLGEYTAACLAGVMSLEDALALVARRARMIDDLPPGAMLAVPLPEDEALRRLSAGLSLAAVNSPSVCVVAGPEDAVGELERRLGEGGLLCRRLQTSHAFHSRMMEPLAGAFRDLVRSVELKAPQIPYLSNVTGTWAEASQVTDPEYWVRHLCGTVRFADAIGELWKAPGRVLLEMGPGQALGSLALQHPAASVSSARPVLPTLRHEHDRQDDQAFLLKTLGQLWLAGVEADPAGFYRGERRRRVPLPTYPFERQRYWIERKVAPAPAMRMEIPAATGKIADPAAWFHAPSWRLSAQPAERKSRKGLWLLLMDDRGVGVEIAARLESEGCRVVEVLPGDKLARLDERRFVLDPASEGDYGALFTELGELPATVVHLWTLSAGEEPPSLESLGRVRETGFYSLIALAQALGKRSLSETVSIRVVTNGLCGVERGDPLQPEKATLLGPIRVMPQEYPRLACRVVDVDVRDLGGSALDTLLAELAESAGEPVTACRGTQRWVPSAEPVRLPALSGPPVRLRDEGVYLITGGLGGLGLALARHLARTVRARLVLVGRTAARTDAVQDLEEAGAEVLVLSADVTDETRMREVMAAARERFGRLDGVFHVAGVPGAGLIQLKTREMAAEVLAPKVDGTLVLASVLRDVPLDFVVLFSALTSITGGIGQVDYCSANAFLDAFAQWSRKRGRHPAFAVNWCEWQWDAWTDRLTAMDSGFQEEFRQQRRMYGLTFEEGMEALSRILASDIPQVVVSTRDLKSVVEQQHSMTDLLASLGSRKALPQQGGARHSRPDLPTPYVAPDGETQQRLADIWRDLLGIAPIGAHDNFFQLGGHSLLGLQVMTRIQEAFRVELPLRALFEAPTIAELAAAIERGGEPSKNVPEIRRADAIDVRKVLENLDALSEEEMDALLAEMAADEEEIYGGGAR
ncbi:MAG TPA: SDR family NAD(P)-dependent oxidoreductase [Thermoanaerobaculia bacterium]